jgi:tRNA (guanine-N7-)-methyltransferase
LAPLFDPYAHAPRLPEEGPIDLRRVFESRSEPPASQGAPFDAALLDSPVEFEIGPGRGWFTLERLEVSPTARVVGLEIKKKWAAIVDDRLKKRGLAERGRTFHGDARLVVPRLVAGSLSHVYLHFPDPWWKKRHEKRLVLSGELLDGLSRALVSGGELFVQTDVEHRAQAYQETIRQHPSFLPVAGGPWVEDHPYIARSPREKIAMRDGIPVYRLRYLRKEGTN